MRTGLDEHDTTPRLIREHPTAQEPPGFWTLLGAVAWIGTRDKRFVAAVEMEQRRWVGEPELFRRTARDLWETDIADDLRYYCASDEPSRQRFNNAVRELMRRLQDGILKASGLKAGDVEPSVPRTIDFAEAEPSFDDTEGFRLLSGWGKLHVHSNDLFSLWPHEGEVLQLVPTDRTGAPGRPSAMHLVMMKMRERFRSGEALPNLRSESVELERWMASNEEYALLAKPLAKSIRNSLGAEYRRLQASNASQPNEP